MTTWNTVTKRTTDYDDAYTYIDEGLPYDVDKLYNTTEYSYGGGYENETNFYTVNKATTTWS